MTFDAKRQGWGGGNVGGGAVGGGLPASVGGADAAWKRERDRRLLEELLEHQAVSPFTPAAGDPRDLLAQLAAEPDRVDEDRWIAWLVRWHRFIRIVRPTWDRLAEEDVAPAARDRGQLMSADLFPLQWEPGHVLIGAARPDDRQHLPAGIEAPGVTWVAMTPVEVVAARRERGPTR